ncbi:hypothetical protein [Endomicrobium proavitum]|uniref:Uncharacterized protein n=1 Tax=Endomicrobium proavitum TaxID=1408281 RepID=A0A0G3WL77_9BACT|nr:hypothetical protein [Endomicrobium proavitum]AKL98640.1 membrane protein of unknown function [Endomicrobium proavitum]
MTKAAFKISEVLSAGWNGFIKNAKFLIAPTVFYIIILIATHLTSDITGNTGLFNLTLSGIAINILHILIFAYISLSFFRACIGTVKNTRLSWDILNNTAKNYFRFIPVYTISYVLYMLLIETTRINSLILTITTMLILTTLYCVLYFTDFMAADKDCKLGIIAIYKKSYDIFTSNLKQCVLYFLILIGLFLATIIVLLVIYIILLVVTGLILHTKDFSAFAYSTPSKAIYYILLTVFMIFVYTPLTVSCVAVYKKLMASKKK